MNIRQAPCPFGCFYWANALINNYYCNIYTSNPLPPPSQCSLWKLYCPQAKSGVHLPHLNVRKHPSILFQKSTRSTIDLYSCAISCQAFEVKWGWGRPGYDTNLTTALHNLCKLFLYFLVSFITGTPSASPQLKGLATKHTSAKWYSKSQAILPRKTFT